MSEGPLEAVRRLRRGISGKRPAPNKPVTLLWALGRLESGQPRMASFADAEPQLRAALAAAGSPGTSPAYAFWWLKSDGPWEVTPTTGLMLRSGDREPVLSEMRSKVFGGLDEVTAAALNKDEGLAALVMAELVEQIEGEGFAAPLEQVGIPERRTRTVERVVRDRRFAAAVVRAYEARCAVCGVHGSVSSRRYGIQAAHIQAVARGGPDTVTNGIALCANHHAAFDAGAFTIDQDLRVVISDLTADDPELVDRAGQPIVVPSAAPPAAAHLQDHRDHVFIEG